MAGLLDLFGYSPQPGSTGAGIADFLGNNSNTLLGLGSGLLSQPNWAAGLGSGFQNAQRGKLLDRQADEYKQKLAGQKATADWAAGQGLDPQTFALLKANPDLASTIAAKKVENQLFPANDEFTIKPGEKRIKNGQIVAEGGPDLTQAPTIKEFNENGKNVQKRFNPNTQSWDYVGDAPVQNRDTPVGFSGESQLSQQLIGQQPYKDYQNARAALSKMQVSVKDPSPAGDIGIVYAYMKMLDPSSVVREGEFATAEQAGGVPARVLNMYNKLLNGERLTPEVRGDFLQKGAQFTNAQGEVAGDLIKDYRARATRYRLNPDNVAPEFQPIEIPKATQQSTANQPPVQGAQQAPDGNWYVADPARPGKYLQVTP